MRICPHFPTMTYGEAMSRFGSDKPDMRVTLEFTDVTDVMKSVDFKVFAGAANMEGGRVVCPARAAGWRDEPL